MSNLTQAEEQALERTYDDIDYIGGCALAALCLLGAIDLILWIAERV